jgi:hypothetical protein
MCAVSGVELLLDVLCYGSSAVTGPCLITCLIYFIVAEF